jgi:hypothetical protein
MLLKLVCSTSARRQGAKENPVFFYRLNLGIFWTNTHTQTQKTNKQTQTHTHTHILYIYICLGLSVLPSGLPSELMCPFFISACPLDVLSQ